MPSTFSWLDHSEHQRRRTLDALRLLQEPTTLDELGVAGVRDAFANTLFPGTSYIHTRVRYFLFVPWMYAKLESDETGSDKVADAARRREVKLIESLKDEAWGVIGIRAKGNVRRLPSNAYWSGLGVWGIRRFGGSQEQYHRSLDRFYRLRGNDRWEREDSDDESWDGVRNWDAALPPAPEFSDTRLSFALTRCEAEYLRDRILTNCPGSLLAYVLRERLPVEADFAWQLPVSQPTLAEWLRHGRNFSETLFGAQCLYQWLLAERCTRADRDELLARFRDDLERWWDGLQARADEWAAWDRPRFWQLVRGANPRIAPPAREFVESWIDLVGTSRSLADVVDRTEPRELIRHREHQLKGARARLLHQRALELWTRTASVAPMDLRWLPARRLLGEILTGLETRDA